MAVKYEKKDWQRSDGKMKSIGRADQNKSRRLRAYKPSDREKTQEERPNEMLSMENSYGGISFGASRQKKLTMVVHEKRVSRGPGLKKDNKEVEGNRTATISRLRGDFKTNSHSRRDSAFAFKESIKETPRRMMEKIQQMMDENHQRSAEQVLPFMNRKESQAERDQIQRELRESQERRDMGAYASWSRRRDSFRQEETEKEQMRRQFFRELQFVGEKSRHLMQEEGKTQTFFEDLTAALAADATEDGTENDAGNETENQINHDTDAKAEHRTEDGAEDETGEKTESERGEDTNLKN